MPDTPPFGQLLEDLMGFFTILIKAAGASRGIGRSRISSIRIHNGHSPHWGRLPNHREPPLSTAIAIQRLRAPDLQKQ